MHKVGDYTIVTDFLNIPKCIIQTTKITIIPFKEMTYEICQREGENENLEAKDLVINFLGICQ